ncbi:F-box/FBD/LRR-repeat protein At1g13570 isoform X1 [Nicotiana tabacum]|uniref:F-box/FBD/LRR-repeat protein At1g13570 isoform X1 n=5 Tax=Nicotiana tabacum TaxID=4097 RepID=A0A1S4D8C7_TOBAC|nr:PREDICTED: F-box/FBD/LRR-repeat protein At1g13570-like isoform X1 [Nicotiana tabacum]XP_016509663.1 PREDICTED: F-box/FBD/LRR-repeat protein At1g13570-like isoform X1 [Nicotiana tabacum]XP_016509664.1 PREDICTED: F-box/FBD/LRR-repeat protein At1g13570-like isoform X1 [Nicotiana tabacum]
MFLLAKIYYMMYPTGRRQYRYRTLPPDILSNLPQKVIDEILICLPLRDAVRTSILSKKWRYIWRRLPQLTLEHTLWKKREDITDLTRNFSEIVRHIYCYHAGPIKKFTLCIPYLDLDRRCPYIDRLISFLSRNGIQHLVLRLPIRGNSYELPPLFFTCFQLRHLTLYNCSMNHPPHFKGFDWLTSLELHDVTISSKLLERLISRSPLLEQFVLHISGALSNVIEISAPMLRSFDYTGNISSVLLKNVPLLAKFSLSQREYHVAAGKCNIAMFFESFSALEHLHLNDMSFVAGAGEIPTRLPFNLNYVKHVCISSIYLSDLDEVSCALCLIRSFPYLQYMEMKVEASDDNDILALESLEVERFSDVTFNHLREVKLIQTNGTIPEMQLMKLLLAKSPRLVRMLIEPCLVEESATVKILAELTKLKRASPKAEVVYKLDKHPNLGPV